MVSTSANSSTLPLRCLQLCISRYTRRMSAVPADLTVSSRWILPMTSPDEVFENHTLVIRDGRILDLLPTTLAAVRYTATAHVDRSRHLVSRHAARGRSRLPLPARRLLRDRQLRQFRRRARRRSGPVVHGDLGRHQPRLQPAAREGHQRARLVRLEERQLQARSLEPEGIVRRSRPASRSDRWGCPCHTCRASRTGSLPRCRRRPATGEYR